MANGCTCISIGRRVRSFDPTMTYDERDLAEKFVKTWQLNVPERRTLRTTPLSGSLIVDAIIEQLQANGWYPVDWRPDQGFDGGLIELLSPTTCRVYWKVEAGVSRFELLNVETFDSLFSGVRAYGIKFFGPNFDVIPIDWSK
jgi:hypothetical protein